MKNLLVLCTLMLTVLTVSCARGDKGDSGGAGGPGPTGPTGPSVVIPPVLPPNVDTIAIVIQEYNENRVAQGQDPVTAGLTCSLYTVPNTTTQIAGASLTGVGSWTYTGVFNVANGSSAPGVNIMPAPLQSVYTSYYLIKCTGLYVQASADYVEMDLSSDDGALVNLNGVFLNNDGTHGITTKSGTKYLSRGVYSFELDYFDIGGSHALLLKSGASLVDAAHFYH